MFNFGFLFCCLMFVTAACTNTKTVQRTPAAEMHIGEQIKKLRIEKGISIKELAKAINMSVENLSLVESGLATPIHFKIVAIQEFLDAELVFRN